MSILVIKHGGPSKIEALNKVKALDDFCLVVDTDPNVSVDTRFLRVPDLSVQEILSAIKKDAFTPSACLTYVDPAKLVTAKTAHELGLPGLNVDAAAVLSDKFKLRRRLRSAGLNNPQFELIDSEIQLIRAASKLNFPLVLKPVSGAYSLGVLYIESKENLKSLFRSAEIELQRSEFSRYFIDQKPFIWIGEIIRGQRTRWILEEYIDGPEISVEMLGHPTHPRVLAIHEKVITECEGHFREDRFVTAPWNLTPSAMDQIREEAKKVAQALNFTKGVCHLEMRLGKDGPVTLELQPCPGGGQISQMVEAGFGINLHSLHAQSFLQHAPLEIEVPDQKAACAMDVLYAERPCKFSITGLAEAAASEGVLTMNILSEEGVVVEPYSEYLGFIVTRGPNGNSAVQRLDATRHKIKIECSPAITNDRTSKRD